MSGKEQPYRGPFEHNEYGERNEERMLRAILEELKDVREDIANLRKDLQPKLVAIELRFGETMSQGPVTLTPTTKTTKATVLGFDATGAPFLGTMPKATYTPDTTAFDSFTDDGNNGDDIVASADGTTNIAVSLTSAEGLALSDTSQIVSSGFTPPPPPPQVLSSIKLDFSTPV